MELVFTGSFNLNDEPYTTGDIIAEFTSIKRESINRIVKRQAERLKHFGKLGFKIQPLPSGQKSKCYLLNEQQATLLITFLKNTPKVAVFKEELVRQFFAMKHELMQRQLIRESGKPIRRSMTDAIKQAGLSPHYYLAYTNLAYKTALGFNAKQLRDARGATAKTSPLDFLTKDELAAINRRENEIAVLISLGFVYKMIKDRLNQQAIIYQTTLKPRVNKQIESEVR